MNDYLAEIDDIERRVEDARAQAARAEARRDAAKDELKRSLQEAVDKFGVKTLADLEEVVDRLKQDAETAMDDLRKAADGL